MKKKSTSQPVSENASTLQRFNALTRRSHLRVLFGVCVMLAGLFLALVSFGPARTGFAQGTTREEMTLTLAQAVGVFQPPACVPGQEMFNDVPASSPFCPFIEELARRGITGGCGGGNYCPGDPVTRAQMAPFIVRSMSTPASFAQDTIDRPITAAAVEITKLSGPGNGGLLTTNFPARLVVNGAVTVGNHGFNGEFSVIKCRLQLNAGSGFANVGPEMSTESPGNTNHDETYDIPLIAVVDRPASTVDVRIVCFDSFHSAGSQPSTRAAAISVVSAAQ
jgi:hypothetical protein